MTFFLTFFMEQFFKVWYSLVLSALGEPNKFKKQILTPKCLIKKLKNHKNMYHQKMSPYGIHYKLVGSDLVVTIKTKLSIKTNTCVYIFS